MDYLSIGAVFRMENSWLEEWIEYHRHVGIERFYLYSDDSDGRVPDRILKPYIDDGIVHLKYIKDMTGIDHSPNAWRQRDVYKVILNEVASKTEWIAMLDLDEFLLPRQCDDARELLQDYEKHAGLAVHWSSFGTSGFIRRPATQINHLLHRGKTAWQRNRFVKSIVRPHLVVADRINNVHHFPMKSGGTVNEKHEPVVNMRSAHIVTNIVRINHYMLRSWQDYWEVKAVRSRSKEAGPCNEKFFKDHDKNDVFDDEIARRFGKTINHQIVNESHA